jgi:hypothetical protein
MARGFYTAKGLAKAKGFSRRQKVFCEGKRFFAATVKYFSPPR